MGSHSVSTHWMYQYYGLYLAWWWLSEPKHVARFLICNVDYQYMLCHWRNKFTVLSQNTTDGCYFVNSMGSHSVSTHWMYQYYGLYLAWWWLSEPKHIVRFLICNVDYQYMLCHWRNKFTVLSQNTTDGCYQRYEWNCMLQVNYGSTSNVSCFLAAFITFFAFLASFFWLNVMCFDIWWTFW